MPAAFDVYVVMHCQCVCDLLMHGHAVQLLSRHLPRMSPLLLRTAANRRANRKLDTRLEEVRAQSQIEPLCNTIREALEGGLMAEVLDPAAGADPNGPGFEAAGSSKVATAAECAASNELEDAEVSNWAARQHLAVLASGARGCESW